MSRELKETTVDEQRDLILEQVRKFHREHQDAQEFVPGVTPLLPAGAVLDEDDRLALVEAALDLRITSGAVTQRFERALARTVGVRKAHMVNSGSSANLLSLTALTSPTLGDARLKLGDEVVTVAAGFPTTVNPIVQNGMIPVFVDVELGTYNTTPERIADAIGPRTRGIMIAHPLGNPYAAAEIAAIAKERDLWFVEDNCDALGSTYHGRPTGSFGAFSTVSFYPAHHITTGEGGCVLTDSPRLARLVESLRDWGRDCWCEPGKDNTCLKRFDHQMGRLPHGYDHKYIFSHIGYNLKSTDLQASLGVTQVAKLHDFSAARRRNWQRMREALDGVPGLIMPRATAGSDPSWFGFVLTVEADAAFTRAELTDHLESRRIGTRRFFAGNLIRHPAYLDVPMRIPQPLTNSDVVTERTFWIGVHPRLTIEMVDYMAGTIRTFATARTCGH
jgi:NDP-hexose-3,4-dehydratase